MKSVSNLCIKVKRNQIYVRYKYDDKNGKTNVVHSGVKSGQKGHWQWRESSHIECIFFSKYIKEPNLSTEWLNFSHASLISNFSCSASLKQIITSVRST